MIETTRPKISIKLETLLKAIPSTESCDFNELCRGLGPDCPAKGDRDEWRDLFKLLDAAEKAGDVDIDRLAGRVESMILTEQGRAKVKACLI